MIIKPNKKQKGDQRKKYEQPRLLSYHMRRCRTDAMHVDSQATQAPNVHTSTRYQKNYGL